MQEYHGQAQFTSKLKLSIASSMTDFEQTISAFFIIGLICDEGKELIYATWNEGSNRYVMNVSVKEKLQKSGVDDVVIELISKTPLFDKQLERLIAVFHEFFNVGNFTSRTIAARSNNDPRSQDISITFSLNFYYLAIGLNSNSGLKDSLVNFLKNNKKDEVYLNFLRILNNFVEHHLFVTHGGNKTYFFRLTDIYEDLLDDKLFKLDHHNVSGDKPEQKGLSVIKNYLKNMHPYIIVESKFPFIVKIKDEMKEDLRSHSQALKIHFETLAKQSRYFIDNIKESTPVSYSGITDSVRVSKNFMLLAGISGTGKSRFVREQAKMWGDAYPNNFELVSVRPDWHEPSDMLGYVTRLGSDDKGPVFVATDVLRFIVNAWLKILECGYELNVETVDNTEVLLAKPNGNEIKEVPAYWLCLDEMNLAPVEQYFADYLSVIETCSWQNGIYSSSAIVKPGTFKELSNDSKESLKVSLGLSDKSEIFDTFLEHGIPLPFNLIVAGTVNMDETTHGFSRKVIDRALTLDFGVFYPSDAISNINYAAFFDAAITDKKLSYPLVTSPGKSFEYKFSEGNADAGQLSYVFFKAVNAILEGTMFELAYRALKELLLAVQNFNPTTQEELCAVWDDFLMMKVLPRIEGDEDKLAYHSTEPNDKGKNILQKLEELLETEFATIWGEEKRPDLLREGAGNIECRSNKKIKQMQRKIKRGFTTFWP